MTLDGRVRVLTTVSYPVDRCERQVSGKTIGSGRARSRAQSRPLGCGEADIQGTCMLSRQKHDALIAERIFEFIKLSRAARRNRGLSAAETASWSVQLTESPRRRAAAAPAGP